MGRGGLPARRSSELLAMIAILLLALALRVAPWGQNRFMEDEALYAAWGLQIATGADPMLDYEPVDKPPLYPYLLALSSLSLQMPPAAADATAWLSAIHRMETAARLPSLMASVTGVALVYALGRRLYHDEWVGLLAALLVALSPFDVLFASTTFTDPLLVALVLAALLAAAAGRPGAAGLLAGLAWATKQQALLFLPLLLAVFLLSGSQRRGERLGQTHNRPPEGAHAGGRVRSAWRGVRRWLGAAWARPWVRLALGLGAVVACVAWWDAARVQRPGYLVQSLISYGGLEPAGAGTLAERALGWLRLTGQFWPAPWVNGLIVAAVVGWLIYSICPKAAMRLRRTTTAGRENAYPLAPDHNPALGQTRTVIREERRIGGVAQGSLKTEDEPASASLSHRRGLALDFILLAFVVLFLAVHWLWGFQVWDRYLLGLVPIVALLAARALVGLGRALPRAGWRAAYGTGLVLLLGLLAAPLGGALGGKLPVGGDHGAYDGIDRLAAFVRTEVPPGAVLYHHWLGYHYRFYLHGAPLRLHWYPDTVDLVQDAIQYRHEPRYIALPSFRDTDPVRVTLASSGIRLVPVYTTMRRDDTVSFRLYRMEGPGG